VAQLTFYFDRNFGKRFPQARDRAKPPFKVEYHHNKTNNFPMRMPDDEWLAIVCKKGWVVFSHDQKFHDIEAEAMAIKQHNGMCFYLPGAQEGVWEKLGYIVKATEKIVATIAATKPPFIFKLHPNLKLERIPLP
jgi:PIN domain-containing protein